MINQRVFMNQLENVTFIQEEAEPRQQFPQR